MKFKTLILLAAIAFCAAMIGNAYADSEGSAAAHVRLRIDPNISVEAVDYNVDLGTVLKYAFPTSQK